MRVKQSTRRRGTRPTPGPKCREPGTESRGWCGKKAGRECVAAEMHCADSRSARLTAASTPECEDHFTQRKPMHALRMNGSMESPRLQIHAQKSCANHAAGSRLHVPQIKRRYTHRGWTQAAVRTAGSTILRAAHPGKSGGVPRMGHGMGPRRPRARASRPCGGAPGGVVSSMQWPVRSRAGCNRAGLSTCPNALVSRHARFSHAQYESNATYRPRL